MTCHDEPQQFFLQCFHFFSSEKKRKSHFCCLLNESVFIIHIVDSMHCFFIHNMVLFKAFIYTHGVIQVYRHCTMKFLGRFMKSCLTKKKLFCTFICCFTIYLFLLHKFYRCVKYMALYELLCIHDILSVIFLFFFDNNVMYTRLKNLSKIYNVTYKYSMR